MLSEFGSPKAGLVSILANLDSSRQSIDNNATRDSFFEYALLDLASIHFRFTNDSHLVDAEVEDARVRIATQISENPQAMFAFVYKSLDLAISAEVDGWFEPCLRRSIFQFLIDYYDGAVDGEDMEYIEEMDEWLRDRAPWVNPLLPGALPTSIPVGHWWWLLPTGTERVPDC
ncbi:hypothetical protein [Nocardia sp. AG03]|uniref:hypothetical protein n=1 Tax=Nocardia sp. AG03 TaxID=3025312 RepID=UPI0024182F34|nr:hypothetical protein [Nocardia sp. AG03]